MVVTDMATNVSLFLVLIETENKAHPSAVTRMKADCRHISEAGEARRMHSLEFVIAVQYYCIVAISSKYRC